MKLRNMLMTTMLFVSSAAFAGPVDQKELKCVDTAVRSAVEQNFKSHGANTNSCGIKLLTAGEFLETYLVCTSDETDPAEWVVVVEKAKSDSRGRVTKRCNVLLADNQHDSQSPNFDSNEGLLKSVECSMEDDDKKATCK